MIQSIPSLVIISASVISTPHNFFDSWVVTYLGGHLNGIQCPNLQRSLLIFVQGADFDGHNVMKSVMLDKIHSHQQGELLASKRFKMLASEH